MVLEAMQGLKWEDKFEPRSPPPPPTHPPRTLYTLLPLAYPWTALPRRLCLRLRLLPLSWSLIRRHLLYNKVDLGKRLVLKKHESVSTPHFWTSP